MSDVDPLSLGWLGSLPFVCRVAGEVYQRPRGVTPGQTATPRSSWPLTLIAASRAPSLNPSYGRDWAAVQRASLDLLPQLFSHL